MSNPSNQPSLEEWEKEISNLCKKALEDEFYGEGEVSFKRRVELEINIAIIVKSLISQAKAQGALEERERIKNMLWNIHVDESDEVKQAWNKSLDLAIFKINNPLTPHKEDNA